VGSTSSPPLETCQESRKTCQPHFRKLTRLPLHFSSPAPNSDSDVSSVPDYHIFDSVIAMNSFAMERSHAKWVTLKPLFPHNRNIMISAFVQKNCGCPHAVADAIEDRIAGSDHLLSKLMDAHEWVKRERQENDTLRIVLQLLRQLRTLTTPHLTSPHLTSPHLTSPHLTTPHHTSPHLTCTESGCACPAMH
jgi:hypothetical protein